MKLMLVMLSEIILLTLALIESKDLLGPDNHQQVLGKEDFDSGIELKPKPEEFQQKEVIPDALQQHAPMVKQLEQLHLEQLRLEQEKRRQEEQRHLRELLKEERQQYAAMVNYLEQHHLETLWKKRQEKQQRDRPQEHRQERQDVEGDGFCGTKHFGK